MDDLIKKIEELIQVVATLETAPHQNHFPGRMDYGSNIDD